jgi:CubicO group peptidase (beta-lactamase class C family)
MKSYLWPRMAMLCAAFVISKVIAAPDDLARMERSIDLRVASGQFMGAVIVARDGKVLLSKGYGEANLNWQIPNSPTTKFGIGSVTKQFTAASILLLQEHGMLKVEDPIKKFLPDAPAAWESITIFNLLTHTSGIPDFAGFPDFNPHQTTPTTPEKLIARFRDKSLDFAPGSDWRYSNSGYVLLGYIIEKLSGESYGQFVKDNIFTPLGMKDSGYDSNTEIIPQHAASYERGPKGPIVAGYVDVSIPFSAGALYSTARDLLRWEQGLYGGKLLSPASLASMTTPFKNNYAFGVEVSRAPNGDKIIDHSGGIAGFVTDLSYIPADRLAVIVLANLNGPGAEEIATDLRNVAHHEAVTLFSDCKAVGVSPAQLDLVSGPYKFADGSLLAVARVGDHLQTTDRGMTRDLATQCKLEYFSKAEDIRLRFERGTDGKIAALELTQHGRESRLPRISDAEAQQITEALAKRARDHVASPGTEAALRRMIAEIGAGMPDYTQMSDAFAAVVRQRLPQLQQTLNSWGAIESVAFKEIGPTGADNFDVKFANGAALIVIKLGPDGKTATAGFQPAP